MKAQDRFDIAVRRRLSDRFKVQVVTDLPPGDPWRVAVWPKDGGKPHAVTVWDWTDPEASAEAACRRLIEFYEGEKKA